MTDSNNQKNTKKNNPQNKTLLKFPCLFPVKIMGLNKPELEKLVKEVIEKYVSDKHKKNIEFKNHVSKHKNYLSITVKFMAESKKQLDMIYEELSKHCSQEEDSLIKMIL